MSDLLNNAEGRNVVLEAQKYLLKRRLARFFKRNLVIDYEQYSKGLAEFDLSTLLGSLNVAWDDELRDLYRLLGTIGGLYESIADTSITVNSTTGSDITGTGSTARPYASLWFMPFLPKRINHKYRILINGDVELNDGLTITNSFGEQGSLAFIGVAPEKEVFAAVASQVASITSQQAVWVEIDGAIATNPDVFTSFLQMTAGNNDGNAVPINRVNAPLARHWVRRDPVNSIALTDTYRYIEPEHTLTLFCGEGHGLYVDGSGSSFVGATNDQAGAHIVFCNLRIAFDFGGSAMDNVCAIKGDVPVAFGFVQFVSLAGGGVGGRYPFEFGCSINQYAPIDDQIVALSTTTINNLFNGFGGQPNGCGLQFIRPDTTAYDAEQHLLDITGGNINQIDVMASVRIFGVSAIVNRMSCKQLVATGSSGYTNFLAVDPNDDTVIAFEIFSSTFTVLNTLIGTCEYGFYLVNGKILFDNGGGDVGATMTVIAQTAMRLRGQSTVYSDGGSWSGTSGTVNDLLFDDPAAPVAAAFPAANSLVSDTLNNHVSRRT